MWRAAISRLRGRYLILTWNFPVAEKHDSLLPDNPFPSVCKEWEFAKKDWNVLLCPVSDLGKKRRPLLTRSTFSWLITLAKREAQQKSRLCEWKRDFILRVCVCVCVCVWDQNQGLRFWVTGIESDEKFVSRSTGLQESVRSLAGGTRRSDSRKKGNHHGNRSSTLSQAIKIFWPPRSNLGRRPFGERGSLRPRRNTQRSITDHKQEFEHCTSRSVRVCRAVASWCCWVHNPSRPSTSSHFAIVFSRHPPTAYSPARILSTDLQWSPLRPILQTIYPSTCDPGTSIIWSRHASSTWQMIRTKFLYEKTWSFFFAAIIVIIIISFPT